MILGVFCDYEGHKDKEKTMMLINDCFESLKKVDIVPSKIIQGDYSIFERNLIAWARHQRLQNHIYCSTMSANLHYRTIQKRNYEIIVNCEIVVLMLINGHSRNTEFCVSSAILCGRPIVTIHPGGRIHFENKYRFDEFMRSKKEKEENNNE